MNIKELEITGNKGFSLLAGINRPVSPGHVTKLATSINNMGVIRPVVATKISFLDNKPIWYIIDGQHLYHACMRIGINIPYVEIKVNNQKELIEKIALLNASSKSWTMQDYLLAWGSINPHYRTLSKYFNIYDLELNQLASLLYKGNMPVYEGSGHISKHIKNGEFVIKNEEECVQIFDYITNVLDIIPRMDRKSNKLFVAIYANFVKNNIKNYNHIQFMKFIEVNKNKFVTVTQDPDKIMKLLEGTI